jgi:hypothetical protein
MMISSVVRDRVSGSAASVGAAESSGGDAQANSAEEAQLTPGPSKGSTLPLAELEVEARYARERYELYRARAYGPRLTSAVRLRELERKSKLAGSRLDRARADSAHSLRMGLQGSPAPRPGTYWSTQTGATR